jgi:putative Mg2+ transporter-C (MgtC) family protein
LALLGSAIGLDRQSANRPAGIRTHALVGVGAALFAAASILILVEAALTESGRGDPVRIPPAIIAGTSTASRATDLPDSET